eukprot:TRINITY_DN3664_c0_g1_i1.p1 TRINITY_DN3664_c0_g1~~TRINITY_DN3664_c0_g1_i1.p1  ORF type:complete len:500 (+),score=196.71 TRINITY_DN3664_c0_g1_i1:146-1645(+)
MLRSLVGSEMCIRDRSTGNGGAGMSSAYSLEPQTEGKVIIHTSRGDVVVELWAKEAPKAVRNFVQLSMEGYYDGCLFHRVIKDFMIQTGDPTGTGTGGESIYGQDFMDEFHSRLRFSHRGLLAMASNGPHTNGSQFFITLGKCEWINHKHTIFGRVTGDSIFNALAIADCEVDSNDRPISSMSTVTSVEVLWNPFDDCFPRPSKIAAPEIVDLAAERKKKKKQKNLALLSFGEEQDEADREIKEITKEIAMKGKSSHDLLDEEGLSRQVDTKVEEAAQKIGDEESYRKNVLKQKIAEAELRAKHELKQSATAEKVDFTERMRRQMEERQSRLGVANKSEKQMERATEQRMEEMIEYSDSESDDDDQGPKKTVLSLKRIRRAKEGEDPAFRIEGDKSGANLREKRLLKAEVHTREKSTLEKLQMFRGALMAKRTAKGDVPVVETEMKLDAASAGKKRKLQQDEIKKEEGQAKSWLEAESEEEESEEDEDWMVHDLSLIHI